MSRRGHMIGSVAVVGVILSGLARADDDLGLKVPTGFRVTVFADETLANDTYAMTLDSLGRVVVTTRGMVKTLHDDQKTGRANRSTIYAETETGGMGLCFDGNDLLFCGDGWLSRFRDTDGDGRADGPPEHLLPLVFTEHGGHAMRKGPDGYWYVIGGNDSKISRLHATLPCSPVIEPEAGAILRLTPDGHQSEILAQGFRNPYDFDFNPAGDIFTYDSDVERDIFLPWYAPTRLYHMAYGGQHGWRVTGYMRSWPRPGDDPGTVDILAPIGRGSPTGFACYRHTQFPERYRGGMFVLDWTFGKVYFASLKPVGGSYKTDVEVFLEPTGTSGFAPTDAVVAPDGSLYISIGGRRTRGSVYKIEYVGPKIAETKRDSSDLETVLSAPQPLDAWSRSRWEPLAEKMGLAPFIRAINDDTLPIEQRIRAIEIVTERFKGLTAQVAEEAARSKSPVVRARVAWSLGRVPVSGAEALHVTLSRDQDAKTRVEALDAWANRLSEAKPDVATAVLLTNLGHDDKRVRAAATRLAATLDARGWEKLEAELQNAPIAARLSGVLASIERNPDRGVHEAEAKQLSEIVGLTADRGLQFQAVRLLQRALGDYHLKNPAIEIETGYSVQPSLEAYRGLKSRIESSIRPLFPSHDERLDEELGRLFAMLESEDHALPGLVSEFLTETSHATRDMHFLIVFARLRGSRTPDQTKRVAKAIVALDSKLTGQEQRIKQSWNDRLGELVRMLLARDPRLAETLIREPGFIASGHVPLALALPAPERGEAARKYLDRLKHDPEEQLSGPLIELLSMLPSSTIRPIFRAQWSNLALRDAILPRLADPAEAADRTKFLEAFESSQPAVVITALTALEQLPRDSAPENLVPVFRLLRRLLLEPKEAALRRRILAFASRESGEKLDVAETRTDAITLRTAYDPVFQWFEQAHPNVAKKLSGDQDLSTLSQRLAKIDWTQGDLARGLKLFQKQGCQTCHAGTRALGPDLTGVTDRLSRNDLFTAIAIPSLDVSPLYRMTLIETRAGFVYSGMIAFESADGLIVQTGATTTVRIPSSDIVSRHIGTGSLMPDQLLNGLNDKDLADLDSYLRSLSTRKKAALTK